MVAGSRFIGLSGLFCYFEVTQDIDRDCLVSSFGEIDDGLSDGVIFLN